MVELVVVVGILALLAVVSAPVLYSYLPSYNLKKATRDIVSKMQLARIHAIQTGVPTVVVFSPTAFVPAGKAGSLMVFEDDNKDGSATATDGNWVYDSGSGEIEVLESMEMPSYVTLISATFTDNGSGTGSATKCFGFSPGGVAARTGVTYVTGNGASGGVVLQNKKGEKRQIEFFASGKTKINIL
jgi:Tfp pilus assembly protein FimT